MKQILQLNSVATVDFIGTGTAGVMLTAAIDTHGVDRGHIENVTVASKEPLDWNVVFFGNDAYNTATIDSENVLGVAQTVVANNLRFGGAGSYYASPAVKQSIPFYSPDKKLYVGLATTSTNKTAGVTGAVKLYVSLATNEV